MGRVTDHIDDATRTWIERQHLFFVATAPSNGGHVNMSPKGLDSFRVLSERRVAYLDLTGSGAETIAHTRENGRLTIMFCAFEGPPRILRLYGRGTSDLAGSDEFTQAAAAFPERRAARAVITLDIERVQDSCGYAVPLMDYVSDRSRLVEWADRRSDAEIVEYWADRNAVSIDGLPAIGGRFTD